MAGFGSCSRLSSANLSFKNPRRGSSHATLVDAKGNAKAFSRVKTMSLQPLEEMVTCPIDLNFLEDPRLLPCGHVFCCQCLNSYLHQLQPAGPVILPCPICRKPCKMTGNERAETLPKAFHHSMLLEYIRGQTMFESAAIIGGDNGEPGSSCNSMATPSPLGRRKNSINITSDALKNLVEDIAALKRSGSTSVLNLAQIMDKVNKLVPPKPPSYLPSLPEPINLEPSAPPMPLEDDTRPTPPTAKPCCGDTRQSSTIGGRFQSAANYALSSPKNGRNNKKSDSNSVSYVNYRDMVSARTEMIRHSKYLCLKKNVGQCSLPRGAMKEVSMHLLPTRGGTHAMQYTVSCDRTNEILHLWRKRIPLHPGRESFNMSASTKSPEKGPDATLCQQLCVDRSDMGKLEIQYVRFFQNFVFMTAIARQEGNYVSETGDSLVDPGLVISCAIPDPNQKLTAEDLNQSNLQSHSQDEKFPIAAVSCIFLRDEVGNSHPERPTISGLDIDRDTGDIYVALCANAMVCRLKSDNMKQVDREWFLKEPQLSPSYLCLAKANNEVWASCPLDDKVFILDLATDTFSQFTPSIMFDIIPSHIIYTSDEKIFLLDTKLSRIFWLRRVHQSICSQRIDNSLKERRKRGIEIIQPVDDVAVSDVMATQRGNPFKGGIMCADKEGSYLIYPRNVVQKQRGASMCCAAL